MRNCCAIPKPVLIPTSVVQVVQSLQDSLTQVAAGLDQWRVPKLSEHSSRPQLDFGVERSWKPQASAQAAQRL